MTDESKCLKCGRCCRRKFRVNGKPVFSDHHCEWLDPDTKLCTVYENRFVVYPSCLSAKQCAERGLLPADCPYVKDIKGYVGPREATLAELAAYHRRRNQ